MQCMIVSLNMSEAGAYPGAGGFGDKSPEPWLEKRNTSFYLGLFNFLMLFWNLSLSQIRNPPQNPFSEIPGYAAGVS